MSTESAPPPPAVLKIQKTKAKGVDFKPLTDGISALKFGRIGEPHEKVFKLSADLNILTWKANTLSRHYGKTRKVDFNRVVRVQKGQTTVPFIRQAKKWSSANQVEKSFSIVYTDNHGAQTTLDIYVEDSKLFEYTFSACKSLLEHVVLEREITPPDTIYNKNMFVKADKDKGGTLSEQEVVKVVEGMNINMTVRAIRTMFKQVDDDNSGNLDMDEFVKFMELLRSRNDLERVWSSILTNEMMPGGNKAWNVEEKVSEAVKKQTIALPDFIRWWRQSQSEIIDKETAIEILSNALYRKYDESEPITYNMWQSVMTNAKINDSFDAAKLPLHQDMTQSMSNYFIASSHNTYLEGDQLTSSSSVKRYVDDLIGGCRCVELDCWDGDSSFDNQPIIYHGMTMTSKIKFSEVIAAIRDHGFDTSPYPIVLSIENHCSLDQQKKMVDIMKSTLGPLLQLPLPSAATLLPSPEQLCRKVLLKGKRTKEEIEEDKEEDEDEDEAAAEGSTSTSTKSPKSSKSSKASKAHAADIHPELSAITFLSTGKVKKFNEETMAIPADKMCSYSEGTTHKHCKKAETVQGWINHNTKHLSRIYPKGTRVDSSNLTPGPAWAAGNQMVALNYQTYDLPYLVNQGKFRENGHAGYVLKPAYMLGVEGAKPSPSRTLVVHIISASQLPKPGGALKGEVIDPFVVVNFSGALGDEAEFKTKVVHNNGFNPVFNEVFSHKIENPDMAHLTITIMDSDVSKNEFIAFTSLPISCAKSGLRTLPLFSGMGKREQEFQYATLFVRIEIV